MWNIHFIENLFLYSQINFYNNDIIIMMSLVLKAVTLQNIFLLPLQHLGIGVTSKMNKLNKYEQIFTCLKLQI